jgi:hypothetical protein
MKAIYFLSLSLLLLLAQQCGSQSTSLAGSPETTFSQLVAAIRAKDIGKYKDCWYEERAEREGMVSRFASDPALWDELAKLVQGEVKLIPDGEEEVQGMKMKKFVVDSPDVPKGEGLRGISMVKVGDTWKMYHW